MTLGKITALYRYPVKSMGGEQHASLSLGMQGIPGDRAWAVRDEKLGGIRGGKRFAQLMSCSARYLDEPAVSGSSPAQITLPSGATLMTGDDSVASELTALIGSPVSFWPLLPKEAVDHYKRGAPVLEDMEAEFRRMFAREPDEPLPDLSAFPPELMEFESPIGTYFDAFPLLLLTQQSLETMSQAVPEQTYDVRRFRPNILLDCATGEDLPERAWEGRTLKIGAATLKLELNCPRCVMTTHGFADLPKDPGIMRSLVKHAHGELGIYASVIEPGAVKVGDTLEFSE